MNCIHGKQEGNVCEECMRLVHPGASESFYAMLRSFVPDPEEVKREERGKVDRMVKALRSGSLR